MSKLIDLSDSKKTAFARGFWKGMAAPLSLYSPVERSGEQGLQSFRALPRRSSGQASDWVNVGNALRAAAKRERETGGS